jgi:hypothetical protein
MNASGSQLPNTSFHELHALIDALLSEQASDTDILRLQQLVCGSPEFRARYVQYVYTSWNLRTWAEHSPLNPPADQLGPCWTDADGVLFDSPASTGSIASGNTSRFQVLPRPSGITFAYLSSGWPLAYLIATVICGLGLAVGALTHVSQPARQLASLRSPLGSGAGGDGKWLPSPAGRGAGGEGDRNGPVVGRITGMVDCQWAKKGTGPICRNGPEGVEHKLDLSPFSPTKTEDQRPKTAVSVGDKFHLVSGLLEITYDSGAKVILQGPVTYSVESPVGGHLSLGKLTARVENSGVKDLRPKTKAPNPKSPNLQISKFIVRTPTATVTDLGTEFGVEVNKKGSTTSQVFRGSVEVRPVLVGGRIGESNRRIVRENESVRVEAGDTGPRVMLVPTSACPRFVREIRKHTIKVVDLVDVVAGGDGFSGRRNHGIDVTTGRPTDSQPPRRDFGLDGDGKYHRAQGLPFVDGVFVPDGRAGRVQVDSAGHVFEGFPESPPETAFNVWAGGEIPTNSTFQASGISFPTELDGVDYASPGHGLLFLHGNKGITFDLEAIRRANRDCKLLRFKTVAANTVTAPSYTQPGAYCCADIWVLVDGQVRFARRRINRSNGVYAILIPLDKNDRFLTLAATDGGDDSTARHSTDYDFILFGDPRLELSARTDSGQDAGGH